MHRQELLSKAVEIRTTAASIAEPELRGELLSIAARFERLALHSKGEAGQSRAAGTPAKIADLPN
jgi:hypothetical protein